MELERNVSHGTCVAPGEPIEPAQDFFFLFFSSFCDVTTLVATCCAMDGS